jgi:hypothetical protein
MAISAPTAATFAMLLRMASSSCLGMVVVQPVLGMFVRNLASDSVFHAAAGGDDFVPGRESVGHLMTPLGRTHQMTARPKMFSDVAQREQKPLRLPR